MDFNRLMKEFGLLSNNNQKFDRNGMSCPSSGRPALPGQWLSIPNEIWIYAILPFCSFVHWYIIGFVSKQFHEIQCNLFVKKRENLKILHSIPPDALDETLQSNAELAEVYFMTKSQGDIDISLATSSIDHYKSYLRTRYWQTLNEDCLQEPFYSIYLKTDPDSVRFVLAEELSKGGFRANAIMFTPSLRRQLRKKDLITYLENMINSSKGKSENVPFDLAMDLYVETNRVFVSLKDERKFLCNLYAFLFVKALKYDLKQLIQESKVIGLSKIVEKILKDRNIPPTVVEFLKLRLDKSIRFPDQLDFN